MTRSVQNHRTGVTATVSCPGATATEFDTAFTEFKAVLGKLRSIQGQYQVAPDGETAPLGPNLPNQNPPRGTGATFGGSEA